MIQGVGHDLVEIGRFAVMLKQPGRLGDKLLKRILTEPERSLAERFAPGSDRLAEFVAGRFAAKEAVVKAFGCGLGGVVGLQDVTILPDEFGKPQCRLQEEALSRLGLGAEAAASFRIHVSITHTSTLASGYAIVEWE